MTRRGIDVSSNNPHPIHWDLVKGSGVDWVAIKATQGVRYVNPYAVEDAASARAAGLEVWLYHFAGSANAVAEADYFLQTAGQIPNDGLILDYEPPAPVDPAWVRSFLDRSKAGMLYSNAARMNQIGVDARRGVLLWVAAYQNVEPPGNWDAWQYTDHADVAGVAAPVDCSYIHFDPPGVAQAPHAPPSIGDLFMDLGPRATARILHVLKWGHEPTPPDLDVYHYALGNAADDMAKDAVVASIFDRESK